MSYSAGRVLYDADSHIMETPDWVTKYTDPSIRERFPPLGLNKAGTATYESISRAMDRVKDPVATAQISSNVVAGPKGWAALGAFDSSERAMALDDLGFARQLVFSTFSASQYLSHEDLDIRYGGARAHNRAMAEFCKSDRRLIPVGQVSLLDPERAVTEIEAGARMGCGAFWIPAAPVGDKSPGHPAFDPIWRTLSELGIPFVLHVGPATQTLPPEYENNGKPRPKDLVGGEDNLRFRNFIVLSAAPQMFLSALVADGVFERFPTLKGGVIELGAGWVPNFLRTLDMGQKVFKKTDHNIAALSMRASDYIRRQVKFTPFAGEDVGGMIRDAGAELFLFSSDYPHTEGTDDPIGRFEKTFKGIDEDAKQRFYSLNFKEMMGAAL